MFPTPEVQEPRDLDIDQTLKIAVEHHKAGRWIEAHKLYKQVLAINPDEPDALRLLGQLTFASGNFKAAVEMIRRAIELRPGVVDFRCYHDGLGTRSRPPGRGIPLRSRACAETVAWEAVSAHCRSPHDPWQRFGRTVGVVRDASGPRGPRAGAGPLTSRPWAG